MAAVDMRARTTDLRIASNETLRAAYERRLRQLKFKRWQYAHKLNDRGMWLVDRSIYSTVLALRRLG